MRTMPSGEPCSNQSNTKESGSRARKDNALSNLTSIGVSTPQACCKGGGRHRCVRHFVLALEDPVPYIAQSGERAAWEAAMYAVYPALLGELQMLLKQWA
eukprot:2340689-Amphidinium_carterae.1